MKLEQKQWTGSWAPSATSTLGESADLVFVFGGTTPLKDENLLREIREMYPKAYQFGCSTSGEISGTTIRDDTLSLVAICFERTTIRHAQVKLTSMEESFQAGQTVAKKLDPAGLRHVLVMSVGLNVNGAELVRGLTTALPPHVSLSGGLAGDKERFQETLVLSDGVASGDTIAVVGFYGDHIHIGSASLGGWDPFGPERLVSKSSGNILYELDGQSALSLYKSYLGKHAVDLPASALQFPLFLRRNEGDDPVVRTILAIDEEAQSMVLAGDLPEGAFVRMMKTNLDRLVEGAKGAAEKSTADKPELALLISCVGRRMVLKQRAEEEVENVRAVFGEDTLLTGFYSYGEISPITPLAKCDLHNQTMTITTFSER